MSIYLLIIYIIASIILFFILNYVRRNSNNCIHSVIITCIYIILIAGIFSGYKHDVIFFIPIFELIIRFFYVTCIQERDFVRNYFLELKSSIIGILFSYFINYYFINEVDRIIPTGKEFRVIIWLLLVIYIIGLLRDKMIIRDRSKYNFSIDREYIVMQYAKFKSQYSNVIRTRNREVIPVIYTIMIYENYYHPSIFRKLSSLWYKIDNRGRCFGIMQVYSRQAISDIDSIKISLKRLEKIFIYHKGKKNFAMRGFQEYYHRKDVRELLSIYRIIEEFIKN